MEANKTNVNNQSHKDEIELRELIMVLWNRKVLIIVITVIFALLAGFFSKFFITPEYKTQFSMVVNIPAAYTNKYGEYTLPLTTNSEYVKLMKSDEVVKEAIKKLGYAEDQVSVASINSKIAIENTGEGQTVFPITISGQEPDETVELANALFESYVPFIDIMIKDAAINHYYNDFTVKYNTNLSKLESSKDLLARQERLLETTPITINQKDALEEIDNTRDFIILENIINPNYTHLEYNILEIKQDINSLESSNVEYKRFLEELGVSIEALEEHYGNGQNGEFETDVISTVEISKLSDPIKPSSKSSPNIKRNVVIAGLLGFMISVFSAFFLAYWKKEI